MYYKDDFEKEFREEVDFHKYLEEVDARAKWVRVPSRSLKVLVASAMRSTALQWNR